jgi:DNA 3'-phosphatase
MINIEKDFDYIVFDIDGTLIHRKPGISPFSSKVQDCYVLGAVSKYLYNLKHNRKTLAIISNQAGVAHGFTTVKKVKDFHEEMIFGRLLELPKIEYHDESFYDTLLSIIEKDDILCSFKDEKSNKKNRYASKTLLRKPDTGMMAVLEHKYQAMNIERVLYIGDRKTDLEFADNCGCGFLHINALHDRILASATNASSQLSAEITTEECIELQHHIRLTRNIK